MMTRVLFISNDIVDHHMGGMGVRSWELAHALANHFQVTLAVPNQPTLVSQEVKLVTYDLEQGDLRSLAAQAHVIITHSFVLHFHPYLRELGIPLAIDLYVPFLLESLVWHNQDEIDGWIPAYEEYLRVQLELLRAGDFFFCASEQQRDYWLGWLHSQKRINPHTYEQDPEFRKLIDVVPFGLPPGHAHSRKPVLKGVIPGIGLLDKVILWSGGLWDWLDPLTLIRAMAILSGQHPEYKLYFLGTQHPNPIVSGMKIADQAQAVSRELGLLDKSIFFGSWTSYHERESYLSEADIAVISHPAHIETHFSFRTRALDCIWAGLPMVVTEGDAISQLVSSTGLGRVVPPGNPEAMADAITQLLENPALPGLAQAFDALREKYRWERVSAPLVAFCQQPQAAPDRGRYKTEAERIAHAKDQLIGQIIQGKDAHLEQVIRDKDAFLVNVTREKDAYLEQVIRSKDEFIEQALRDKDTYLNQALQDKDAFYEEVLRNKENEKQQIIMSKTVEMEVIQSKQAIVEKAYRDRLAEIELALREIEINLEACQRDHLQAKQALEAGEVEIHSLRASLERYQRLLPVRFYRRLKRMLGKD